MKIIALSAAALLSWGSAHAAPPCQDMADKVAGELAAEKKMSDLDKPAKCRAIYKILSGLTDIVSQCAADSKFMEATKPLAKSVADEAPRVCQG